MLGVVFYKEPFILPPLTFISLLLLLFFVILVQHYLPTVIFYYVLTVLSGFVGSVLG